MSFIRRELWRVENALRDPANDIRKAELYAVQQALAWALEPGGFRAPYAMITGTSEGSGDCSSTPQAS